MTLLLGTIFKFFSNNAKPILFVVAVGGLFTVYRVYHTNVIEGLEKDKTELQSVVKAKDGNITTLQSSIRVLKGKLDNKNFECKQVTDIINLEKEKERIEDVKTDVIKYPDVNGTIVNFK